MLNRKDKYYVLLLVLLFQGVCIAYKHGIHPVIFYQIDMISEGMEQSEKVLLLPVAFIFFGQFLLLFALLQKQIGSFNLISFIGIGALATTVLLLGIITVRPLLVFGSAMPFVIFSVIFIYRMWRKADMEKYMVHDRDREREREKYR